MSDFESCKQKKYQFSNSTRRKGSLHHWCGLTNSLLFRYWYYLLFDDAVSLAPIFSCSSPAFWGRTIFNRVLIFYMACIRFHYGCTSLPLKTLPYLSESHYGSTIGSGIPCGKHDNQDKAISIIMAVANGCPNPTKTPYFMSSSKTLQPNFSIIAFQSGQQNAFGTVFDHYYPALCFFATRLIQNVSAAEDIAQETLIKLWEKHAGFHNAKAIKSFLYITARNACINFMKRSQIGEKKHEQWAQVWDESEDFVLNQLTRAEVLREVYNMLNMLPPECRKVMRHSFVDGLDNQQIAQLLNISIHTVKNQKARAIYLIKKKLGGEALLLLSLL